MNVNDKFLDSYKQLEAELKYENKTVLDYENSLVGTELEQLKVCRIMRNYFSHNDITFLATTTEQVKFIDNLIMNIRRAAHTVKDEMKRVKPVASTELIKNILPQIDKNPYIPMETPNGLYLLTRAIVIHNLALGLKKIEVPKRLPKLKYVAKDVRIETLAKDVYVVTDNGLETGKYLGVLDLA